MREPYADKPHWYGKANWPLDTLQTILRETLELRQQPILHAVGDSSIAMIFTAMRAVAPDSTWQRVRLRIEHADNFMEDQFQDARQLGVVIVVNPTHLLPEFTAPRWNPPRRARSDVLRSMVTYGIPLAIGSDGPLNPFLNLMLAVRHPANPPQGLTLEQAVVAYTRMSAYAERADGEKGSLAPGKLADLAVLSQDIFAVPLDALPATTSVLTLVGGRATYDQLTAKPAKKIP
jgi:predicted amidohydrolase YtcJ